MAQATATLYNLADLKATSDEALANYLESLGFSQSHALLYTHLGLGYTSLALAGACWLWDYKLGFDATKFYSLAAVCVYALLSLTMTFFERKNNSIVYVGTAPNGETIRISTSSPKLTPTYEVEVTVTAKDKDGKTKTAAVSIARPYAEWFNSAGQFVKRPFQTMLTANVAVIASADTKRTGHATTTENAKDAVDVLSSLPQYSAAVLDMLAADSSPAATSGADSNTATTTGASSGSKGGKRRKN